MKQENYYILILFINPPPVPQGGAIKRDHSLNGVLLSTRLYIIFVHNIAYNVYYIYI